MRASLPTLPGATLIIVPLSFGCLKAVAEGDADAASNDLINLTLLRKASARPGQCEVIDIGDHFDPKSFGIAAKKGNQSLVAFLNQTLEALKDRLLKTNIFDVEHLPATS